LMEVGTGMTLTRLMFSDRRCARGRYEATGPVTTTFRTGARPIKNEVEESLSRQPNLR
jgi:hypothetical protein